MNIFRLDDNPALAAQYHCDTHVVKMCLEYGQILSTALHLVSGLDTKAMGFPAPTHKGHPSVLWAAESFGNWHWLHGLYCQLQDEYRYRYNKVYSHWRLRSRFLNVALDHPDVPVSWLAEGQTPLRLAMPKHCYVYNKDGAIMPVQSYQYYYLTEKGHLLTYKKRPKPDWVKYHAIADDIDKKMASL